MLVRRIGTSAVIGARAWPRVSSAAPLLPLGALLVGYRLIARALPPGYAPGDPSSTPLYRIVSENLDAFLEEAEEAYDAPLPDYVVDEFRAYLECGQFGPGFLRCHCDGCGQDMLIAFSCKRRGVCQSCGTRRMCNEAAHLTDRVLPSVPVRQWVLSLPFELRRLAAFRADVLTMLGRTFVEEIFRASGLRGAGREGGAVTFVQRFGGSLNLNVHFHVLVLDGAFARAGDGTRFHETPPPSPDVIATVARRVHDRAVRWLRRRKLVTSAEEDRSDDPSKGTALDACAALALRTAGLVDVSANRGKASPTNPLDARGPARFSAAFEGFDVHAAVRVEANDDDARERLVRYCARPALALDRLTLSRDGAVCYRVKYARGTKTHRVMRPAEFLARLAALIPPPRFPLVRYHGVLAPNSAWRKLVVPRPANDQRAHHRAKNPERLQTIAAASGGAPASTPRMPGMRNPDYDVGAGIITVRHWGRLSNGALLAISPRVAWAELLRRTHGVDVLLCPRCQGRMRLLSAVTDPEAAREILAGLGVTKPPAPDRPAQRARAPDPQLALPWPA